MSVDPASDLTVRPLLQPDWPRVSQIYAAGIATGHATFESEPPAWSTFDRTRHPDLRLVVVDAHDTVLGWAAASPVSERCVYAGVVEHSVYVDPAVQQRGIGRHLLGALTAAAEAAGVWTVQSGIFPENEHSLALHRSAGFRVVGTRERIGRMTYGPLAGTWRDVLFIERRSEVGGA